ncbi:MAG TPA: cell wall-binding repeat-containing protein, partial [Acidimicrobiales bacterium]|nr:cell wall-binding repeat-containing protein [Acidimicrobiales bacterium]
SNGAAAPMFHTSLSTQSADPAACAGVKDQLNLTVVAPATGDTTVGDVTWDITIGNIYYSLGLGTPADNSGNPIGTSGSDKPASGTLTGLTVAPNAAVAPVSIQSDSPTVALTYGQTKAISNITVTELHPGELVGAGTANAPGGSNNPDATGGEVSMCLNNGNTWSGQATITATNTEVSATGDTGSFGSSVVLTADGHCYYFWVEPTGTDANPDAATLTASGLTATAALYYTNGPQYVTLHDYIGGDYVDAVAFDGLDSYRLQGATADDTAIATFNDNFGPNGTWLDRCNGGASVVIASDTEPWDSLSANLLARTLHTGLILIPGSSIPQNVLNLIRNDGIGNVYLVGGPGVISQAVQNQLSSTQAFFAGGMVGVNTSNDNGYDGYYSDVTVNNGNPPQPINLNVVRIGGQSADDTSSMVDQYFGFWATGTIDNTPGAYATDINPNGEYNNTAGTESATAPNGYFGELQTAIVTTDQNYQDAISAGTLSYSNALPVVLTPGGSLSAAAQATIQNLGIQQVIVMGGQAAVSDAVVHAIQGMVTFNGDPIAVLRVAGQTAGDTSQLFARFLLDDVNQNGMVNGLGYSWSTCGLNNAQWVATARGDYYTDALAAASWLDGEPLVLTQSPSVIGSAVESFLTEGGTFQGIGSDRVQLWGVDVFGGPGAQSQALVNQEINDIAAGLS